MQTPNADDGTDKLRERDSDKGGGGQKIRKFCGRLKSIAPDSSTVLKWTFWIGNLLSSDILLYFCHKVVVTISDTQCTPFHLFAVNSEDCLTIADASPVLKCIFPFMVVGVTYNSCTSKYSPNGNPWCSTKVDEDGVHINEAGNWGYCSPECPIEGKSKMSW